MKTFVVGMGVENTTVIAGAKLIKSPYPPAGVLIRLKPPLKPCTTT